MSPSIQGELQAAVPDHPEPATAILPLAHTLVHPVASA
jgi:hypothetical protein